MLNVGELTGLSDTSELLRRTLSQWGLTDRCEYRAATIEPSGMAGTKRPAAHTVRLPGLTSLVGDWISASTVPARSMAARCMVAVTTVVAAALVRDATELRVHQQQRLSAVAIHARSTRARYALMPRQGVSFRD